LGYRSDEGLALETSAFESLYGGQFTLSTQLIQPNYLVSIEAWREITLTANFICSTILFNTNFITLYDEMLNKND